MTNKTPAKQAAEIAPIKLAQVTRMLGTKENGNPVVNITTLGNWCRDKPLLFKAVLLGCAHIRDDKKPADQKGD